MTFKDSVTPGLTRSLLPYLAVPAFSMDPGSGAGVTTTSGLAAKAHHAEVSGVYCLSRNTSVFNVNWGQHLVGRRCGLLFFKNTVPN